MKKMIAAGTAAMILAMFSPGSTQWHNVYPTARAADKQADSELDKMAQMRLTLKKLEEAMSSMKDFDQLEASGMSKQNVDRMRRAMQIKINQMMEEVIQQIHSL